MSAALTVAAMLTLAAPAPTAIEDAKTYFEAGQQAYRAGFYLDAARAFEQAYELVPNPAITFSVGQTYRRQFLLDGDPAHLRRAILAYRGYLKDVPRGGRSEDAIENLAELERRRVALGLPAVEAAAEARAEARKTQLMISSQTEGAQAVLDGAAPQAVPLVAEVSPGAHEIEVSAAGHFPQTVRAVAIEGRLVVSQVELRPRPASLKVRGTSGAQVTIDGRIVGKVPFPNPVDLEAGRHLVTATRSGRHAFVREVEVARGESLELVADLETTTQREVSYWFIGGGTVLMVSTGVLVAVALVSEGQARLLLRKQEVDEQNLTAQELDRYISARNRRNDMLTVSTATLVGSVLVGGIGAALFFLDDSEPLYQPGGISPLISTDGRVGLSWQGSF